jgi:hypothetical protein
MQIFGAHSIISTAAFWSCKNDFLSQGKKMCEREQGIEENMRLSA